MAFFRLKQSKTLPSTLQHVLAYHGSKCHII
jgi:hypothetical protein